jgi:hypothetical protein
MEGQPNEMMVNDAELAPEPSEVLPDPFGKVPPDRKELAKHAEGIYGVEVSEEDIQVIE